MGVLSLPDIPEGANPYAIIFKQIRAALNPTPTPGFATRLAILWALAG